MAADTVPDAGEDATGPSLPRPRRRHQLRIFIQADEMGDVVAQASEFIESIERSFHAGANEAQGTIDGPSWDGAFDLTAAAIPASADAEEAAG